MSIGGRAYSKKPRTQTNKQRQCAGARIQKQTRTQANTIDARLFAFKKVAHSIKQCQCAGPHIQRNRERKQTKSMRERAHSNTLRIQRNNINVKARVFKQSRNSRNQDQCADAHLTKQRTQANKVNAPARAFNKTANSTWNVNVRARAFNKHANSSKQYQFEGANIQRNRELKQTISM